MLKIANISIREFRGIRELDLDLSCKPFAVWGPNGSGKSGVIDAIDFALTGSVSRLTGAGSGGVTLLRHGPHVHSRDAPVKAEVSLEIVTTSGGRRAVLRRDVRSPKTFTLTPEIAEVREAVERVASHPELTLARRDIIKFVTAEAGERSKEVQALLKLEKLSQARLDSTGQRNTPQVVDHDRGGRWHAWAGRGCPMRTALICGSVGG
ncbi:ATP-binding protein, partial [Pseudonocardia sp. McavD-2-B]|uniref:ATP-binding protein n=1 Tax=Pseudonocardia sp. McavD-2-B TaxID=2954499 RepID=UPI0035ABAEED